MTSRQLNVSNLNDNLNFVNDLVNEQRLTKTQSIEKLHKEHKKHLHIEEYKLIIRLFQGLEKSLMIEYLDYLNNSTDTYFLFDVWALDKLVRIYSGTK